MGRLFRRLRMLLHPARSRELAEEMQFHREQQRAEGLSAAEAERAFGNELRWRERSREAWGWLWLEQLGQDLRQCGRQWRRRPGYVAAAITVLGLGVGANTALFSVVEAVLLHPLPYPHAERLVRIVGVPLLRMTMAGPGLTGVYPHWQAPALEQTAVWEQGEVNVGGEGGRLPEQVPAAEVSLDFFQLLGVAPRGIGMRRGEDHAGRDQVVVLGHALAQRWGGTPGETIRLNAAEYQVAGVMPAGFGFPAGAEAWLPLPQPWNMETDTLASRAIFFNELGRLRPGSTSAEARAELIRAANTPAAYQPEVAVTPLQESQTAAAAPVLWLLLAAVGLVLLIACANTANLQLMRALERRQEMAMRQALGAGPGRLVRQHLAESLALGLAGGGAGCLLAWLGLPGLRLLLPARLPLAAPLALDGRVLGFTLATAVLGGVLVGLFPALQAARVRRLGALPAGATGKEGRRLRNGLAVVELALATILLAGAGLLLQSLWRLAQVDLGFQPQGVLTAKLSLSGERYHADTERADFFRRLQVRLATLPGVASAALGDNLPLNTGATIIVRVKAEGTKGAYFTYVTPGYFRTLGIAPIAGRDFGDSDHLGGAKVAIVNQALAAALWPHASPVGKTLVLPWRPGVTQSLAIVGEVGNIHLTPGAEAAATLYMPVAQFPGSSVAIVVRARGHAAELATGLRRTVAGIDPDVPLAQVATMPELMRADLADPRFRTILLGLFAGLALGLSVVGLGGVVAYAAAQRTHEIGVRMALGARAEAVGGMVLAEGLRLAGMGVALGLGGALALAQVLARWLYGVRGYDPATLAGTAALLGLTCAGACWWPARRAARVDPAVALRCE